MGYLGAPRACGGQIPQTAILEAHMQRHRPGGAFSASPSPRDGCRERSDGAPVTLIPCFRSRHYQFVMKWLYSPLRVIPVQGPTLETPPVLDIAVPHAWTRP